MHQRSLFTPSTASWVCYTSEPRPFGLSDRFNYTALAENNKNKDEIFKKKSLGENAVWWRLITNVVFERLLTFLHTLNVKKADVVFDGSKIFNSFLQEASSPLFVSTPVTDLTCLSGLQPIHSQMFLLLHPPDSFIHAKMASPFTHTHTPTHSPGAGSPLTPGYLLAVVFWGLFMDDMYGYIWLWDAFILYLLTQLI